MLAGLGVALLFARWVWDRLPRRSAVFAVVVLLVYPYAFFLYGAVYADALFVLCSIGAFLLLERRWYVAAGLVGALATAGQAGRDRGGGRSGRARPRAARDGPRGRAGTGPAA